MAQRYEIIEIDGLNQKGYLSLYLMLTSLQP